MENATCLHLEVLAQFKTPLSKTHALELEKLFRHTFPSLLLEVQNDDDQAYHLFTASPFVQPYEIRNYQRITEVKISLPIPFTTESVDAVDIRSAVKEEILDILEVLGSLECTVTEGVVRIILSLKNGLKLKLETRELKIAPSSMDAFTDNLPLSDFLT